MPVVVQPAATSANLGPGFDCLGLALKFRDRLTFDYADSFAVTVIGEGADDIACDESHLVLRSYRAGFAAVGAPAPTVSLVCENKIPHGRGMGSSSAAIVAGLIAAREFGADLSTTELLEIATGIEGHPDNVAPVILGGATIAWTENGRGRAVRLEPVESLPVTIAIPPFRLATEAARALLPNEVTMADAVHNLGRSALMVAALTTDPDLLFAATEDRLHQDARRSAYPQSWDLVQRLRAAGVPAAISGAGPSVIAFGPIAEAAPDWRIVSVPVAAHGVLVDTVNAK